MAKNRGQQKSEGVSQAPEGVQPGAAQDQSDQQPGGALPGCDHCMMTAGVDGSLMHAATCPTLTVDKGLPPPESTKAPENAGAAPTVEVLQQALSDLTDYSKGDFVVVKKDDFAALIHDLVRGYDRAWVGLGAKNKLLGMVAGVTREQFEEVYQNFKAHDNAKDGQGAIS